MVKFNFETAPQEWYCQGRNGCILFSLLNGGYILPYVIDSDLKRIFPKNIDIKNIPLEDQVLYDLKAITLWALITGYYPFEHKESFYTIYTAFMKLRNNREKIAPDKYKKKVLNYAKKIKDFCDFFANHDGMSLNNGTWNAGNHLRLTAETFATLEDLPYKTLLCIKGCHWVVYLGAYDEDSIIVLDPKIHDGYNRIPITELTGQKIIKPKNVYCDARIQDIFSFFSSNPRDMLDSLRRREFSVKMAEIIKRLDEISFTEHDYNRYLKLSRGFLESLDKEHYRYEF